MNKRALLDWLDDEHRQWQALLDEIGRDRMEQPGVNGNWSFKNMVAHLNGWQQRMIANLQAAQRGQPEPPPPWPPEVETVDEVNAWIYETNRDRPLADVLNDTESMYTQLVGLIDNLPPNTRIDPQWHLVYFGEEYIPAGEFFDHYRDDHEVDVQVWLARLNEAASS